MSGITKKKKKGTRGGGGGGGGGGALMQFLNDEAAVHWREITNTVCIYRQEPIFTASTHKSQHPYCPSLTNVFSIASSKEYSARYNCRTTTTLRAVTFLKLGTSN